ncbi:MAG: hypothetical protein NC830_07130, partial [Candidatus Omnitrophica bacterium]|nr:hypothetical protein [Candidatus Omnitrophota bacterium]
MNTNNDFFTIFIFPFKYEMKGNKQLKPDEAAKKLSSGNTDCGKGWAIEYYSLDRIDNYNEFYYFHPNVQRVLFNKKGNEKKCEKENKGMQFLKREDFKKLKVEYYDKDNVIQPIETQVNEIDIHLFDNQIGLLTISTEKLEGDNKTDFPTFLRYNDITRRAYPPYLGDKNTCSLKFDSKILPVKITLVNEKDPNKSIPEYFKPIDLETNKKKDIVSLSKIIKGLLDPFKLKHTHKMDMKKDEFYYTPFIDDRMFIVSYYSDNEVSYKLKHRCCDGYEYERSDDWYRFIFVDGNYANIENDAMKKDLIRKHTYARWANYGSLFGMSRYSFVLLCSTDAPSYLKQHMKSMYYQIALIVLFQRAMLLKFAEDIDDLTWYFEVGKLSPELKEDSDKLRGDFIKFINKYWFIEVTPQEQGIEIYNQWMDLLNLEKLYTEVQREVSELAEYVENKIEAETNKRLAIITYVGLPLAILGLILMVWQPKPSVTNLFIACPIG